jgi:hypothetical protein
MAFQRNRLFTWGGAAKLQLSTMKKNALKPNKNMRFSEKLNQHFVEEIGAQLARRSGASRDFGATTTPAFAACDAPTAQISSQPNGHDIAKVRHRI